MDYGRIMKRSNSRSELLVLSSTGVKDNTAFVNDDDDQLHQLYNGDNKSCESGDSSDYVDSCCDKNIIQDSDVISLNAIRDSSTSFSHRNRNTLKCPAIRRVQSTAVDLSTPNDDRIREQPIPAGNLPHVCATCNKTFSKLSTFRRHEITHTIRAHFTCDVCGKSFVSASKLRIHLTIHTDERPFHCGECSKTFTKSSSLLRHKSVHTGGGAFVCAVCDKRFSVPSNLKRHEMIHSDLRMFSCGVCKRTFSQENNLEIHMVVHTGERKYSCEVCRKKFTHASSLSRHERFCTYDQLFVIKPFPDVAPNDDVNESATVAVVEPERLFTCETCDRQFTFLSNLRRHERFHVGARPFVCKLCEKCFILKEHLMRHELIHSGERPFVCEICQKTFTQATNLRAHKLVHATVPPFECDICKKPFTRRANLIRHKMSHVGEGSFVFPLQDKLMDGRFTGSVDQSSHSEDDESPKIQKFGCGICGEMFDDSLRAKSCFVKHDTVVSSRCDACERISEAEDDDKTCLCHNDSSRLRVA